MVYKIEMFAYAHTGVVSVANRFCEKLGTPQIVRLNGIRCGSISP